MITFLLLTPSGQNMFVLMALWGQFDVIAWDWVQWSLEQRLMHHIWLLLVTKCISAVMHKSFKNNPFACKPKGPVFHSVASKVQKTQCRCCWCCNALFRRHTWSYSRSDTGCDLVYWKLLMYMMMRKFKHRRAPRLRVSVDVMMKTWADEVSSCFTATVRAHQSFPKIKK